MTVYCEINEEVTAPFEREFIRQSDHHSYFKHYLVSTKCAYFLLELTEKFLCLIVSVSIISSINKGAYLFCFSSESLSWIHITNRRVYLVFLCDCKGLWTEVYTNYQRMSSFCMGLSTGCRLCHTTVILSQIRWMNWMFLEMKKYIKLGGLHFLSIEFLCQFKYYWVILFWMIISYI